MHSRQLLQNLILFSILFAQGCTDSPGAKNPGSEATTTQQASATQKKSKALPVLGDSPEFRLIDQSNSEFGSEQLKGRVAVVNFVFTACPGTCPRQSERMAELNNRFRHLSIREGIHLVTITVDPESDTPEVLKKYAQRYEADPELWKFLSGERDEIWRLSKEGFHMAVADNPNDSLIPIAHDSKFALIDRLGRIRGYFDAITEDGFKNLQKALDVVLPEFAPDSESFASPQDGRLITHLAQPPEILNSEWLLNKADEESKILSNADVRHDFRLESALEKTGISLDPQIVDDQRWRLIVNHYDHGNSVSAADVDGDGLVDLYFTTQVGPNELWRNLGSGRFENITEQANVALVDRICVAASFADVDNDGDADLFVTSVRGGNAFLVNDGKGRFSDETTAAGLNYNGHSSTGTFFDYDQDGLLDLFVTNIGKFTSEEFAEVRRDLANTQPETTVSYWVGTKDAFGGHLKQELAEQSILYRNLGGNKFSDVTEAAGIVDTNWSGDSIPLDINSDGWLDLYVLNMQGNDHLYVNQAGKNFSDQTARYFPKTPWGAMGAKAFDWDNNGLVDIMVTDMHSDMSEDVGPQSEKLKSQMQWPEQFLKSNKQSIFGNAFYRQSTPGKFDEISDSINAENYWPWGLCTGDLNADGFQDVFITSSMCFPYRYGINSLLLNEKGQRFVDAQFHLGVEPRQAEKMMFPWFSLDADGVDSGHQMCQGREGTVVVWSAPGSRSAVLLDLDSDGDLDIVTNEFNTPPQVFFSTLSQQPSLSFVSVRLKGTSSNRDGLGAAVTVSTEDRVQSQWCDGKSGYLAQSSLPLYFGLGDAESVAKIEVRWPSGTVQTLDGPLDINRQHEIVEAP
jgi:cytochrome oxidase Cu insertion factor (SCO1/SenC/PrrC family)